MTDFYRIYLDPTTIRWYRQSMTKKQKLSVLGAAWGVYDIVDADK